jgi:hypothetical protein
VAAHIFPLAHKDHWGNNNFACWILIHLTSGDSINAVQNGMLLRSDIHSLFHAYRFSDVCTSQPSRI